MKAINGKVKEKFIDNGNHSYPTIVVSTASQEKKIEFAQELSGFYQFLEIGDQLNKESNSLFIEILRHGKSISRTMDYGCNQ